MTESYAQQSDVGGSDPAEVTTEQILEEVVNLRGGHPRPQQQEMTAAVTHALESGENLVVQAGTGVGKSLGYLTPLMWHAAKSGNVQVVATSSLALQRQILTQDAPLVSQALEKLMGASVSVAVLKGWANYICRLKLQSDSDPDGMLWDDAYAGKKGAEEVAALAEWAETTNTGDRDEVPFKVSPAAWRQVSLGKRECLGRACPFMNDCFPASAKENAFEADVVVTNHALLGVYVGGNPEVLPEFDALVIDEAHDVSARVRTQGTQQLWISQITRIARAARKLDGGSTNDLERAGDLLEEAMGNTELGLQTFRSDGLNRAVIALDDASKELRKGLKSANGAQEEVALARVRAGLDGIDEVIEAWASNPEYSIVWISESESGSRALNIAPLHVAGLLHESAFTEHTTILTSATLSLGGTFEQVKWETGIGKGNASYLDVGTPFSPSVQGILYIASHLEAPARDWPTEKALDELLKLVTAANGGALGLFSSWRAAEAATNHLRAHTDYEILFQRDDNVPALVEQFKNDRSSCLIGTMSLWQGVDVPGDSCRLVILDRIPFPRPDDPIVKAQQRAAEKAGRSAFQEVSLAPAALAMAQGAGRLLRGIHDKGVVAVLDSRLASKSYGTFIRRSLLPYWPTTNLETVQGALRRLGKNDDTA